MNVESLGSDKVNTVLFECKPCKTSFEQKEHYEQHLTTPSHQNALLNLPDTEVEATKNTNIYFCELCKKGVIRKDKHMKSKQHLQNYFNLHGKYPEPITRCLVCETDIVASYYESHVTQKLHKTNLEKFDAVSLKDWEQYARGRTEIPVEEFKKLNTWKMTDETFSHVVHLFYEFDPQTITLQTYKNIELVYNTFHRAAINEMISFSTAKSILEDLRVFSKAIEKIKEKQYFIELKKLPLKHITFEVFVKIMVGLGQIEHNIMDETE
jgi:hypothetical protein